MVDSGQAEAERKLLYVLRLYVCEQESADDCGTLNKAHKAACRQRQPCKKNSACLPYRPQRQDTSPCFATDIIPCEGQGA